MEAVKRHTLCRRLLLLPAPLQGHINPMLHLASLLYSKGFSITIIQTPYNAVNPTQFPHFTFRFFSNSLLESYSKSTTPPDTSTITSAMNNGCSEAFRDCLSQILCDDQEHVAALIADPMWNFAGSIAASFNLPRIVLRTGSMSALLVYCSLPSLREKGYFSPQEAHLEEPLVEFSPLKVKDLPSESKHHALETRVLEAKSSQGIICNTFEELEDASIARLRQIFHTPIFPIGPLHKQLPTSTVNLGEQDQTSIAWLNNKLPNSVLYVSFGSLATISKAKFLELAWGLLESMVPFLWVVRTTLIQGTEDNCPLPQGYLEMTGARGHIVKWAPQLEVLSHPAIGGYWTHNGWNSTLESISEGVPMLCQPLVADQHMNARHVSEGYRIGLKLKEEICREDITKAIRKLMLEEEGAKWRSRAATLKEKATECIKEGGSSYKSLDKLTSYLLSF